MSGGKPVFVSVMYPPRARIRLGSDQSVASCPREETSFSRRSRSLVRAGQVRMACWNVSGSVLQRGHEGLSPHRTRRGGRPGNSSPLAFGGSSRPGTFLGP